MIPYSVAMVMNARDILECLDPIRRLKIDKVWFRGFTQRQVARQIKRFVESTDYDRYILISDDVAPKQSALDCILRLQGYAEAITGWCNLSPELWRANVILRPLKESAYHKATSNIPAFLGRHLAALISGGIFPFKHLYEFVSYSSFPPCDAISAMRHEIFRTYFMGGPLLSMSRRLWLRHGYDPPEWGGPAFGADMALALELANAGEKMWCARDAFCYHLHTTRNFIVGKVEPEIIYEKLKEVTA